MTFDDAWLCWWHLMMLYDAWWCLMTLDDAWWRLMTLDDLWWCLIKTNILIFPEQHKGCIWSAIIMHLIIKTHAFDHQESCIWSSRIIHLIIKNHACYNIMSAIASLIATYRRYALVLLIKGQLLLNVIKHHKAS